MWEPQQEGLEGFHWVQVFEGEIISPHFDLSHTKWLAGADPAIRVSLDRIMAYPLRRQSGRLLDAWPAAQRWPGSNDPTLELVGHDGQVVASTEANTYGLVHRPPGGPYVDWWRARFLNPPEYGSYRLVWDSGTIIAAERSPGRAVAVDRVAAEGKVFAENERARVTWTIHGPGCDRFDYEFYYSVDHGRTHVRVPDPVMPDANTVAFSRAKRPTRMCRCRPSGPASWWWPQGARAGPPPRRPCSRSSPTAPSPSR